MTKTKLIFPVILLLISAIIVLMVIKTPPQSKRGRPSNNAQLAVDVQTIIAQDYAISIDSYGTVTPRTQSVLLPQVSGQITYISDNFRSGGFFQRGEVLLRLDQRDYIAEIKIAQANLYSAKQVLIEEQARSRQAEQDWQRLGNGEQASDLVLRQPQLQSAKARVESAEASLAKAKLALERTEIIAPYTGRVLRQKVDLGQVVSPNSQLADIYAVDYVEVRLPIKNKDLAYVNLPESKQYYALNNQVKAFPKVSFSSDLVANQHWQGQLIRTEGAFDSNSQQLFVVAQINDPYGLSAASTGNVLATDNTRQKIQLKIGQYLTARIDGKTISNALIIPNKTIYQGSYVYLVNDGKLQRKNITLAWQNEHFAMVKTGLNASQLLVTTPLGQVNSGTLVSIASKDGSQVAHTADNGPDKKSNKMERKQRASQATKKHGQSTAKDKQKNQTKPATTESDTNLGAQS